MLHLPRTPGHGACLWFLFHFLHPSLWPASWTACSRSSNTLVTKTLDVRLRKDIAGVKVPLRWSSVYILLVLITSTAWHRHGGEPQWRQHLGDGGRRLKLQAIVRFTVDFSQSEMHETLLQKRKGYSWLHLSVHFCGKKRTVMYAQAHTHTFTIAWKACNDPPAMLSVSGTLQTPDSEEQSWKSPPWGLALIVSKDVMEASKGD